VILHGIASAVAADISAGSPTWSGASSSASVTGDEKHQFGHLGHSLLTRLRQ
jgi:hypothetical protein